MLGWKELSIFESHESVEFSPESYYYFEIIKQKWVRSMRLPQLKSFERTMNTNIIKDFILTFVRSIDNKSCNCSLIWIILEQFRSIREFLFPKFSSINNFGQWLILLVIYMPQLLLLVAFLDTIKPVAIILFWHFLFNRKILFITNSKHLKPFALSSINDFDF